MAQVFIDGAAGTTGLQVHDRLRDDPELDLIILNDEERKNDNARKQAMAAADITILCLPDDAAITAVQMAQEVSARIIDASTAHRTDANFVYGFAELCSGQEQKIAETDRVSNPGCYPTGFLGLVRPLIDADLLKDDAILPVSAVSGYTGGGKAMIARYEQGHAAPFTTYGLELQHKHLPEMREHGHLQHHPIFLPSVGNFPQGMLVNVLIDRQMFRCDLHQQDIFDIWKSHYQDSKIVSAKQPEHLSDAGFLAADGIAGTDCLELVCFNDAQNTRFVLTARLDNLGKGASGAAVQNLNLMLGRDPLTGLVLGSS